MINEGDVYICDFCGEDVGRFNQETGNHPECEENNLLKKRIAELERIIIGLATMKNSGKNSCQYIEVYDDEGLLDVVEVSSAGASSYKTPVKLSSKIASNLQNAESPTNER